MFRNIGWTGFKLFVFQLSWNTYHSEYAKWYFTCQWQKLNLYLNQTIDFNKEKLPICGEVKIVYCSVIRVINSFPRIPWAHTLHCTVQPVIQIPMLSGAPLTSIITNWSLCDPITYRRASFWVAGVTKWSHSVWWSDLTRST